MTPLVKICGLRTPETLDAAIAAGADMVGFVFFPKSPRHVGFEAARALGARARGYARIVALTVDADDALIADLRGAGPDVLQLHGKESPERVAAIGELFGRATMKAVGVAAPEDLAAAGLYDGVADFLLIDAKPPKGAALPGGNGRPFDWRLDARFLPGARGFCPAAFSPTMSRRRSADRRARRRRVLGRRERAGRQGRNPNRGLRRRGAMGLARTPLEWSE